MNEIQIFSNPEFGEVRTTTINNEPWFVGRDVAQVLGYNDTAQAIRKHVDPEDKGVVEMTTPGGVQSITAINESGLYSLILSSKLPGAKKFKHWVTSEVLPAIRKNGGYLAGQEEMSDSEIMAKALMVAQKTIEERGNRIRQLSEQNEEMKPKALMADAVTASKDTILIRDMAKILCQNGYQTGEKRFFETLRNDGYLIKGHGSDRNMPTQRSIELGLFFIKENVIIGDGKPPILRPTIKVTGKGQLYFINKYAGNSKN